MAFMLVFIREERLYPDWLTTAIPFIEILFSAACHCRLALLFHLFPYGRPLPRWLIVIPITAIVTATVFQFAAAYALQRGGVLMDGADGSINCTVRTGAGICSSCRCWPPCCRD